MLIPLGLNRLRIDPAIASSAFVTTVTDVVSFLVTNQTIPTEDAGSDRAAAAAAADTIRALGIVAGSTLGRVWLVALAILLVGLLGEREDGLAAALLTLALVTVHLGCLAFSKLVYPEDKA